jgi:pyruvate dehydrogenase E2 component (dihydrolipoamide acetyltransferase)
MVPALKNADEMDLTRLSVELKSIADASKKGNINPELIHSPAASFTVSNLGNYGVEMFTPVINLPQVAILGVCTIINRPASIGNNTFGFIPYIGLSLTYDHRAIDGGPATLFLKEIKDQIEAFTY